MLEHSFLHCKGIAQATAKRLNGAGYHSWDQALTAPSQLPLGAKRRQKLVNEILESKDALRKNDIFFFLSRLPKEERWRVLAEFFQDASYLDIETTGFSPYYSEITMISLLHLGKVHVFVKGENLKRIITMLTNIKLLVTFCGSSFDVPFMLEAFRLEKLPCAHIDLRWQSYYLGWSGGLKKIESSLGLRRPKKYQEMSGNDAILLWEQYIKTKNRSYLNKLKAYSILDVLSLRLLSLYLLREKKIKIAEFAELKENFESQGYIDSILNEK